MKNGQAGRVLVMGDDMRIFLAVVRSLGRAGLDVHAAPFDPASPALKSRYVAQVHRLPAYVANPLAWLDALRGILRAHRFDLVIPCCDRAILALDAHREALADWRLAIPNRTAMSLLFDKDLTHTLCRDLAIPVVAGRRLSPGDEAGELVDRLGLPLVVKPRRSYWIDEMKTWGRVSIPGSTAELAAVLRTLEKPERYLAEAFFPGDGVGVSVLAKDGEVQQAFQHRRLREGHGGSSSYRISETLDPELVAVSRKVCGHTAFTGVCMFEFRRNPARRDWVLLETNARFWGSMPLPLALGIDFPVLLYDLLVHDRSHPMITYKAGVRSRNILLDVHNIYRNAARVGWRATVGAVADFLVQPVRWLAGLEVSDAFARDDWMPAVAEIESVVARVAHAHLPIGRGPQRGGARGADANA